MRNHKFSIETDEPEDEVLRHLEMQRSKLDYGDGDDDPDEVNYDEFEEEFDSPQKLESKYTKKIQELFSEEEETEGKVKMAKKKAKKTRAKKAVKKTVKKQPAKKEVAKEVKPVAVEELVTNVEETKPELAPNPEPEVPQPIVAPPTVQTPGPQPEESGLFRKFVVLVIIVLLLFLAYKYTAPQSAPTGASFAEACASNYVLEKGAYELSSASADDAGKFWLDKLLTTSDENVARDIATMFTCKDVQVTLESSPEEFEDCEKQEVYLVVTEADLKSALDSELASCTKIDDMVSCSNGYFITGDEALKNGESPAKLVLGGEETEFEGGNEDVVHVFESGDEWLSLVLTESDEEKVGVKLFTEQEVDGFALKYRTEEPRVVAWQLN